MSISTEAFLSEAKRLGAADVRFVSPEPFEQWKRDSGERLSGVHQSPLCVDPKELLSDARSIAVLFFAAEPFPKENSPFPRYYVISNLGYHAARVLTTLLQSQGAQAVHGTRLPARAAALRSGGIVGENGLYYHPSLGSFVHIELIVNDLFFSEDDGEVHGCRHCGKCGEVCPTGAIGSSGLLMCHCLRNHLFQTDMPLEMRQHVHELLGCERCQRICPINNDIVPIPITDEQCDAMSLERLLCGSLLPTKTILGNNLAKRRFLASQAILVIEAQGLSDYGGLLNGMRDAGHSIAYLDWALLRNIDGNL